MCYGAAGLVPRGPRSRPARASRAGARRPAAVCRAGRVRAPARRLPPPPRPPGGVRPPRARPPGPRLPRAERPTRARLRPARGLCPRAPGPLRPRAPVARPRERAAGPAARGRGGVRGRRALLDAGAVARRGGDGRDRGGLGRDGPLAHGARARGHDRAGDRAPVQRDDTLDEEPRVQIRLACPRRVRERWHVVTVLARAVLGAEVAPWQVAEAAAAEGFSARGGELADPMAGTPGPEATPPPEPIDLHETPADLDWTAVTEALPGDLERLGEGAGALNAFALDQRMRTLVRARQRIDWQMGRLLRTFFALRLHRLMGFPSAAAYARERLGLSPRKARALVALERKTWEAPALLAAYREGQLSWLRALMLLPVLSEENAPAWIGRAQAVTVRRLVDEVEWVVERQAAAGVPAAASGPPPPGAALVVAERQMRAHQAGPRLDGQIGFYAPAD